MSAPDLSAGASPPRRIVAIGGGGFLMDDERGVQERWILSLCRQPRQPRVLYVGTASGDSPFAQLKFMRLFSRLGARPDTLAFFPYDMRRDYAAAVRDADVVYVGGGNTVAMVAVWREFGFDRALRRAWEAGTVLAGISAGANCWFERYVTDSVPGGGVREGLGLLPGTFCPHLDSEGWRPAVVNAQSGEVTAAGEQVCALYEGTRWVESVTDRWADDAAAMPPSVSVRAAMPAQALRRERDAEGAVAPVVPRPLDEHRRAPG